MIKCENHIEDVIKQIKKASTDSSKEISITVLADIIPNVPVETGNLARSMTTLKKVDSNKIKIFWGSNVVYAAKVEFENKSYLRSTISKDKDKILSILIKHFSKVGKL